MSYYKDKVSTYYTNVREDLIDLMPDNPNQSVLEIGAGGGDTLVAIKERNIGRLVVGVDLMALENTNQTHPSIDQFFIMDIEKDDIPFPYNHFNIIICGDILEHLIDPWAVIKKIVAYLKKDGLLIISIPNIRNYKILLKIFGDGSFDYDPKGGILDKTHLRFFCRTNIIQLLDIPELNLSKIVPINYHPKYRFSLKVRFFNFLTAKIFEEFFVHQYLAVAVRR